MAKIITVPDPRLRQKSAPITKLDKAALKLIADLKKTLVSHNDPEGVGLSAPQIGANKRVFLIKNVVLTPRKNPSDTRSEGSFVQRTQDDDILVVVNPEILEFSKDTNWDHLAPADRYFEGCLSIPEVYGEVQRPWSIKVRYQTVVPDPDSISNFKFQISNSHLTDYDAIYFQHEFDHLEGILFTDRVLEQGGKLFRQTAKSEFDEIA